MKPYDWCNPSCPDPCTCVEKIEKNIDAAHAGHTEPDASCPLCRPCCGDPADCQEGCRVDPEFASNWE